MILIIHVNLLEREDAHQAPILAVALAGTLFPLLLDHNDLPFPDLPGKSGPEIEEVTERGSQSTAAEEEHLP